MENRFVNQTGFIDSLPSGDEVRQVKQKHLSACLVELGNAKSVRNIESSLVFKYYPGLEDALYVYYGTRSSRTHEGESGIRQPDKIFITLSNSAHKHRSLSELEAIVRQFILRRRQVVRQLEESTSSNSAHIDCLFSELALSSYMEYVSWKMNGLLYASNSPLAINPVCERRVKINVFYLDAHHDRGYVRIKETISLLSGFDANSLLLVQQNLHLLCLTEENLLNLLKELEFVRDRSDEDLQNLLKELGFVKDQSTIPYEPPRDHSREQSNSTSDNNMQNMLKEGKDQVIRELLGIPNKTQRYYPQKQSNSNIGICKLLNKFILDDPKDTFENNSSKSREIILDNLLADYTRKYGNLFKEARSRVGQVRKRTDLWHGNVLASRDNELFPEGSFAGNVQKLMKKDLNRLGAGGNGEIVEAFYQRKHLVIKQTLLRELELSVVPKLEHKNLLPWFAIISGEKSERRPGQVSCYQIMQKMTEDLSASIRTIGGSIHDHILSLQQDNVPKAVVSQQAELMRRNTSGVFRNVLEGLEYLHEQCLVHRDIKASNILLKKPESCTHTSVFTCDCTPHWEVKVADFDSIGQIFVLRERAAMRGKKKSKSGYRPFLKVSATGTSGYRAPEIFEEFTTSDLHDPEYFGPASDIWALGGVGIHIVMGFCTPRKQYQFGLMMLAHRGMLKGEERDDIISRTLGLHHISEGFPGEKWKDMINFVSRPLQIDLHRRPSAKDLLQDPFIQRYNTTPGLDTVVNETATLDTALPRNIEVNTKPQQIENRSNNKNDISGPNSQASGNQHC